MTYAALVRRSLVGMLAALALLITGAPAAATDTGEHYVALGDSFTAGPFIPVQRLDPLGCFRSTRNYPAMVAAALAVDEYTDVSCSAARTEHTTSPQPITLGAHPPQFDALRADTDLVTVSIGGNDAGFADTVTTCGRLSVTDPWGDPCRDQATAGGTDVYAERIDAIAPEVAGVLAGIRERSPDATIVLVGYLRLLPPTDGCFPIVPIARGDVPYLDGLQQQLTAVLAEQAAEADALFVDAYAASLGRDTCAGPLTRWVEGVFPNRPAFPVHPNAAGMRAVADLVVDAVSL